MINISDIVIRLSLSCLLGGLVGVERESINKPAGFRTHILVCVGATVVMLTSLLLFEEFKSFTTLDPARLGAQVISGIGFLGAGTILREGLTVKGLTTAASLWAVGCIGLAIGSGFYLVGILGSLTVLITLFIFSPIAKYFTKRNNQLMLRIVSLNKPGQIGRIGTKLGSMHISITNISLESIDGISVAIYLTLKTPRGTLSQDVVEKISTIENISNVEIIEH